MSSFCFSSDDFAMILEVVNSTIKGFAMSMDNEIKESIEKNLPAMVGKKLQERLALVDQLEKKIEQKDIEYTSLRIENKRLVEMNNDLLLKESAVSELSRKITEREKVVVDIEHKLEIAALKLEFTTKGAETVERLFNTVFRNTVVRNNIHESKTKDIYSAVYQNGMQTGTMKTGSYEDPVFKSETKEEM